MSRLKGLINFGCGYHGSKVLRAYLVEEPLRHLGAPCGLEENVSHPLSHIYFLNVHAAIHGSRLVISDT